MDNSLNSLASEILLRDNFLIVSHERPDGDAIGSALGVCSFLNENSKRSIVYFSDELPKKFAELSNFDNTIANWVENIIIIDCANQERIGVDKSVLEGKTIFNIDHHHGNDVIANYSCVVPNASSSCELCAEIFFPHGKISEKTATFWMLGMITDTGGFRFSNTTSKTFQIASKLMDYGADYEKLNNIIFFNKARKQQKFEAKLVEEYMQFNNNNQFAFAVIPDKLFEEYDFSMREGEGLIDLLRELNEVIVCALIYNKNGDAKISLRSKNSSYPVLEIARTLGGGGHKLAAGITLENTNINDAAKILTEKVAELFNRKN